MKILNLNVLSKNKNSFKNFLGFIYENNIFRKICLKKNCFKKSKKIKLTVLKSPHVNKTSQEQFEIKFYKKLLKIQILKSFYYLIFSKKLNNNLLSDVNFKYFITNNKIDWYFKTQIFNLNNFRLNKSCNYKLKNFNLLKTDNFYLPLKKIDNLIQILELQGEFFWYF